MALPPWGPRAAWVPSPQLSSPLCPPLPFPAWREYWGTPSAPPKTAWPDVPPPRTREGWVQRPLANQGQGWGSFTRSGSAGTDPPPEQHHFGPAVEMHRLTPLWGQPDPGHRSAGVIWSCHRTQGGFPMFFPFFSYAALGTANWEEGEIRGWPSPHPSLPCPAGPGGSSTPAVPGARSGLPTARCTQSRDKAQLDELGCRCRGKEGFSLRCPGCPETSAGRADPGCSGEAVGNQAGHPEHLPGHPHVCARIIPLPLGMGSCLGGGEAGVVPHILKDRC